MNNEFIESHIHDIPDFPKEGIIFKDISPLLASAKARSITTELLVRDFRGQTIDVVVGIESRGFLFGMLLADALNAKFVMLRKPGKLPGAIISQEYELEYGTDTLELQENAISPGDCVLIHDDVLATGGTAMAAAQIIQKAGGKVEGFNFVIELDFINGREKIKDYKIASVLHY
ncbi:adenine phosphoribosyltransferase [Nonlabens ulvanivorans]|nr:adenine phosphoribosyltransferase [Nonlabens ulvanivorans]GAK94627.1 adenine phosphoribosyltransferase [Nonlabens ulvanivorans]